MIPDAPAERIAFIRTLAPLLWSLALTQLLNWGIDFDAWLAGQLGVTEALVNGVATVATTVALWVAARQWPTLLERLLMFIPIDNYAYTRHDDLVTPNGRVPAAASVIDIPRDGIGASDRFVEVFLARQPSDYALRRTAGQLLNAADTQT